MVLDTLLIVVALSGQPDTSKVQQFAEVSAAEVAKLSLTDEMYDRVNEDYPELKDWFFRETYGIFFEGINSCLQHGVVDKDERMLG